MPITEEEKRRRAHKGLKNFVEWLDRHHTGIHIGAIEELSDNELTSLKSFYEHVLRHNVTKDIPAGVGG
jgi:hypothetical protein